MSRGTQTVRLSFRTTVEHMDKIAAIAEAKRWLNAKGAPNVSRVINFVLEEFDTRSLKKKKR